jgi:hypothetical protein
LPEVNVLFKPDEKGAESLARQIKMTGRAYPLFPIALMILQKPERHWVTFSVVKKPDGQVAQPLFLCALDETLWFSEDEAIKYALDRHFSTFYQMERTAAEPPKGTYTFVAQCGMSGVILGPPNHHDYQNQLRKLHAERFARVPFEVFKGRVKIVRDEAVVKKWVEEQSFKTQYVCLNMPESLRLNSREEVEKHFRETHQPIIIKSVESHSLSGTACRALREPGLVRLLRQKLDDQRRFPLQIATVLSQQFATHGLQFFKVNKTVTHVTVARPHYLDLDATPVSEGVRRIVDFITAHSRCTRRQLVEALVGTRAAKTDQTPGAGTSAVSTPASPATAAREPSPEETAVIADLHWLIHQGHVIEFADGVLETAKKPVPRPPKPVAAHPPQAGTDQSTAQTSGEAAASDATEPNPSPPAGEAPPAPANAVTSTQDSTTNEVKPDERIEPTSHPALTAESPNQTAPEGVPSTAEKD